MPRGLQAHVAFYVKDLEDTVDKWKRLLAILDPEMAKQEPVYLHSGSGEKTTVTATFVNPNGLELQFVCPKAFADDPDTVDRVDHIAFVTPDVDGAFKAVRDAGFVTNGFGMTDPTDKVTSGEGIIDGLEWQRWFLVPMPGKVCAEVALPYQPVEGRWEPVEDFSPDAHYGALDKAG